MSQDFALVFTDIVDSTAINNRLGDDSMAALWDEHDKASRELLRHWQGREVDRSDGFLMLFDSCAHAVAFSADYHRMLSTLAVPLRARAGVHVGALTLRETPAADVALGAKPIEAVGIAKAVGSRVMALAQAGQTLLSASAQAALAASGATAQWQCVSHGHWRLKGLDPLQIFEVVDAQTLCAPLEDSDKAQRVALVSGHWLLVREVPNSLPAERELMIGRSAELLALDRQYRDGARLITITGAGGMGKTRLALRYAWNWLGEHPGGVWFCDLSSALSADGLDFAVSQGLGVPLGKDPVAQLARAIAGRGRCLVVLDNFEQVRRLARDTLGRWLDAAPQARFLVTSREVLGLPGERTSVLSPLGLQDGATLFHQRASAAHAEHDPMAHAMEVRQLVALLDGMPLAIELAAPRVRVMPPPVLLARMGDRFRMLASTDGRTDRQSTLRATLAWSWDLLTTAERAMLAQLSVFEGGFAWAAVPQVVSLDDAPDTPWVMDLMQSLVEKSLVTRLAHGRFGLLRSVQEFAAEQLQGDAGFPGSGPPFAAATRRRHHRHHATLTEAQATADACAEVDNLVQACRQAVAGGQHADAVACLRLAHSALRFQGPYELSATLAEGVRQMPGLTPGQTVEAERVLATALRRMGANAAARIAAQRGLDCEPADEDAAARSGLHCVLAEAALASGDFGTCESHVADAINLAQRSKDPWTQCAALNMAGALRQYQGRLETAREQYRAGLALAEAAGLRRWQGGFLGNLAGVDYGAGRLDAALAVYEKSLQVAQEIGDLQWQGYGHCNLGMIHLEAGRLAEAETHLLVSLARSQSLGYPQLTNTVNCNLGLLAQRRGLAKLAVERIQMAVESALAAGDHLFAVQYLGCLAPALALAGDLPAARDALGRAHALLPASADAQTLGLLACSLGHVEWIAERPEAARAALLLAMGHLSVSNAGQNSELGRRCQELDKLLRPTGLPVPSVHADDDGI